jgi:hypothetical protein
MKRMVIISDLHCGHRVGLTPPAWWWRDDTELQAKVHRNQKELWNWYASKMANLQPIDILVVNGDAIDGKGERSGGSEQNTTDRFVQCDMAVECIREAKASTVLMTYGTQYHTGADEDWERVIADKLRDDATVHIEGHAFPNVNGVQFDIKHHIGSSGVPHGRYTAIARDKLWNTVWNNRDEQQPKAGVLIRSHVHYHSFCGCPEWLALTTPALQGYGSLYGVRRCSGVVDIGIVVFDIQENGVYQWKAITAKLPQQFVKPLTL